VVELSAFYMGALIAKMQQRPQFEARVRDRNLDTILSSLLLGFGHEAVFIYVEHTPDMVIVLILVLVASCSCCSIPLHLHGTFDQGLWRSPSAKFQLDEAAFQMADLLKIRWLRQCALANDQKSRTGLQESTAAAE